MLPVLPELREVIDGHGRTSPLVECVGDECPTLLSVGVAVADDSKHDVLDLQHCVRVLSCIGFRRDETIDGRRGEVWA